MKLRYHVLAALAAALVATSAALATPSDRSTSGVWRLADGSQVLGATSTLVRTDQGAAFTIRTNGLAAGDAVTVWWVVFNDPEFCTAGEGDFRCGIGDLLAFGGDPRVASSVFHAAGHVIGGSGTAGFGGHTTTDGPAGEVLWGPGLVNARTADIHLVVRRTGLRWRSSSPARSSRSASPAPTSRPSLAAAARTRAWTSSSPFTRRRTPRTDLSQTRNTSR